MSMKNFNDTIGNQSRDPPACSAVPQPTAPPRTPKNKVYVNEIKTEFVPTDSPFTQSGYLFSS
jgi:hypothetical protein